MKNLTKSFTKSIKTSFYLILKKVIGLLIMKNLIMARLKVIKEVTQKKKSLSYPAIKK